MSGQIRQRRNYTSEMDALQTPSSPRSRLPDAALSASTLLKSSPTHHGKVMKLNIPFIYSLAPSCLRKVLQFLPYPFRPTWRERHLIQIGKYVYRFSYEGNANAKMGTDNHQSKMKLKGTPIHLETLQSNMARHTRYGVITDSIHTEEEIPFLQELPSACDGYFSITSKSKTRYYAVATQEEAGTWVNSLREGRQSTITHKMGHDPRPYPRSWTYIDKMGDETVKTKERIRQRMQSMERKEMEMTEFSDGLSGAMPSGYYG